MIIIYTLLHLLRLFTAEHSVSTAMSINVANNLCWTEVSADDCLPKQARGITTLDRIKHEKNFNQCYSARRAESWHGRWTTSIRPRHRNTLPKPEES